MNNYNKTINEIEGNNLQSNPKFSNLVNRCIELRDLPLNKLEVEDLRILLGQNIAVDLTLPIALNILEDNPLAEGDFYEGDLLKSVFGIDSGYWSSKDQLIERINKIYEKALILFDEIDLTEDIKDTIMDAYKKMHLSH